MRQYWPWISLILAVFVFSVFYIPGYFVSVLDTEMAMLGVFYHDVVENHHPFADWCWGGCTDLFPDVAIVFLFNFLFRSGWLALQLLVTFYFISWLVATASLAIILKRPNKLALFSILLLLWIGLICNFGLPFDWGLRITNPLLEPMYHSGTGLLCLVCLVLLIDQISKGRNSGFWWLGVLTFLGGISDILFLVDFVGPSLLTLALLALAFRENWKTYLWLGVNLVLASVAAYFLAPYCFPVQLATDSYVHLSFHSAYVTFFVVLGEMSQPEHHLFAFIGVLDVLTILGGIAGVLFFFFSPRRKLISPLVFSLLVFCSSAVFLDWFITLFTGVYGDMNADRYLAVALLIPMFLIVFALHAIVQWRPWIEKLFAAVIAIFIISISFIPQGAHPDYQGMRNDVSFLETLVKERHLQAGLGDYWTSNLCTFLSHGNVSLLPTNGDGTIYHWFCSLEWFGKGLPVREWPHIRWAYQPDPAFRQVFGPPDEIVTLPSNSPVWIYSEQRAIIYNEYFDVLSNKLLDGGRTMRIAASTLPSDTGIVQDTSRLATEGRDHEGFLNGGPAMPLKPAPYRVTFRYEYLLRPAPDKLPVYDILVHTPGAEDRELNTAPVPYSGTGPQTLDHDFTVSKTGQTFEMRIFYHASGTIRLDSIDVTYTGL